jgi:hypothetical protein
VPVHWIRRVLVMRGVLTARATMLGSRAPLQTRPRPVHQNNVIQVSVLECPDSARSKPAFRITGYCRLNGCASFPASELGEVCRNDASCINAETWSETPAYCAGPAGVPATCGGGSAFCYSLNSASTGFSPTCASGKCGEQRTCQTAG